MAALPEAKHVLDLCEQALLLPTNQRADFLASVCAGDRRLRQAVETLMQAVEDSGNFMTVEEKST